MLNYTNPPLTFNGNKRNQVENFIEVLNIFESSHLINKDTIFLDVFGGSGFLSELCKRKYPQNEVIWNDYDDYNFRLENIETTEAIRAELHEKIGIKYHIAKTAKEKKHRLNINHEKPVIIEILSKYEESKIDFLQLSAYLCFQFCYIKNLESLEKINIYNNIAKTQIKKRGDYLKGVKRVQMDFRDLMDTYKDIKNKILILDPPYLQTTNEPYVDKINLVDFLELLERLQKPYIYFTNKKSELKDVLIYLSKKYEALNNITFRSSYENSKFIYNVKKAKKENTDYIIYNDPGGLFKDL